MDQNGRPLKIEDKVTLTLLINNRITLSYRTKKIHQRIRIVNRENYVQQIRGKIIVITTKIGLDAAKPVSKNVFHKTFEATGELRKNCETKLIPEANSRNVEETVIPPEKRQEILNQLRQTYNGAPYKM